MPTVRLAEGVGVFLPRLVGQGLQVDVFVPWHRCGRDSDLQTFGPERRRTGQNSCSLGKQFVDEVYSRLVPILALAYEHDLDPEIVLCSKVVPGNPPD